MSQENLKTPQSETISVNNKEIEIQFSREEGIIHAEAFSDRQCVLTGVTGENRDVVIGEVTRLIKDAIKDGGF